MTELPGKELAAELLRQSREESRTTPMEDVIAVVRQGNFSDERAFRLLARLWTLERLFYYIYGDWGKSLILNDLPPSPKYLFAKQVLDESTHEMLYMDEMLRRGWIKSVKEIFEHPYGRFFMDSGMATYAFSLINLATYPHYVRLAALNLGAKVLEQGWMEGLVEVLPDEALKAVFVSQFVENRSHITMGRRVIEELVSEPFAAALCRWANSVIKRDYRRCLEEMADFILDRKPLEVKPTPVVVVD